MSAAIDWAANKLAVAVVEWLASDGDDQRFTEVESWAKVWKKAVCDDGRNPVWDGDPPRVGSLDPADHLDCDSTCSLFQAEHMARREELEWRTPKRHGQEGTSGETS